MSDTINIRTLGEGRYGIVFEGIWNGYKVAIKRIQLAHISSNEREEQALQKLNHPNVIKLLHAENDAHFRHYYLELCEASLDKLFLADGDSKKYRGPMPPKVEVLYQLAVGLEYIHKMKFIHRDIKPENVLIWVNPENGQVLMKWADFGLSRRVNERGTFTMSGVKGTELWLAPEILKLLDDGEAKEDEREIRGTVKTDVFAEGLVFGYYLTDGLHLYGSRFQIAPNIIANNPVNLSKIQPQNVRDLIEKMLADQPEKRITSSVVVLELERIRNPVDQMKLFALLKAKIHPSEEEIKILIDKGIDLNYVDKNGLTPLHYLIREKSKAYDNSSLLELLQFLIGKGTDVNCKDGKGWNALHLLCQYYKKENLIDIIKLLIENGIDVNCKANEGGNALHYLCWHYQNENLVGIIRLLIENGIDVNCKNDNGFNALHYLCKNYQKENLIDIIKLLVENGIDVNCKDKYGDNALHYLCRHYQKEILADIIRLLIDYGIDVHCKDRYGQNAIAILQRAYRK